MSRWPRPKYHDLVRAFGKPGDPRHQCMMTFPYPMQLAWDNDVTVTRASVNVACRQAMEATFEDVLGHYGRAAIRELRLDQYGGIYNLRKIRGGRRWSMHAYAAAVDLDPVNNRLRWDDTKASFARTEYDGLHRAFEKVGAVNLGRRFNFDWQHFEFTDRPQH